jgi:hypothetical protein
MSEISRKVLLPPPLGLYRFQVLDFLPGRRHSQIIMSSASELLAVTHFSTNSLLSSCELASCKMTGMLSYKQARSARLLPRLQRHPGLRLDNKRDALRSGHGSRTMYDHRLRLATVRLGQRQAFASLACLNEPLDAFCRSRRCPPVPGAFTFGAVTLHVIVRRHNADGAAVLFFPCCCIVCCCVSYESLFCLA